MLNRTPLVGGRLKLPLAMFVLALSATLLGCGGSDDSEQTTSAAEQTTSASSVKAHLLPASLIKPLILERTFDWQNATDFVAQGISLPESTAPSQAIKAIEDAGFSVAAGQQLVSKGGVPAFVAVASFDSTDGATNAQNYLHGQDLQQPCFASCSVDAHSFTIPGIPGFTGVHQTPNGIKPPPGYEPFERDLGEFTIGNYLYVVEADGDPGSIPPAQFDAAVKGFYQHAKQVG